MFKKQEVYGVVKVKQRKKKYIDKINILEGKIAEDIKTCFQRMNLDLYAYISYPLGKCLMLCLRKFADSYVTLLVYLSCFKFYWKIRLIM